MGTHSLEELRLNKKFKMHKSGVVTTKYGLTVMTEKSYNHIKEHYKIFY